MRPALEKKKANSKRRIFPPLFDQETGRFTDRYSAYTREIAVCYDLVDIAKEVLSRPEITLIPGGDHERVFRAYTDGTNIYLPKMHPNRLVATKHELSHLYFDSDITLRLEFVQTLIRKIHPPPLKMLSTLESDPTST